MKKNIPQFFIILIVITLMSSFALARVEQPTNWESFETVWGALLDLQGQIDSFFDVFVEIATYEQGVLELQSGMNFLEGRISQLEAQPECPSGMVSYWKFDEGSGTTISDSADANHGTVYGAIWTTGKVNGALSFDGNDYVEIQSDPSFNLSSFTLEAWVKFTQSNVTARIISRPSGGGTYGHSFFALNNVWGAISGGVQGEGQNYSVSVSTESSTFADDSWHMAAFVRDVQLNKISIYVDGVFYSSDPDSSPGGMAHNYENIIIGSYDGSSKFFQGLVDEVAIYNRVLTETEITEHYNNGLLGIGYCEAVAPVCGNDVLESPEECDDGNNADGDGCSADCFLEDLDNDGYTADVDCDDTNPKVHPGHAHDYCSRDAVDYDCDGNFENGADTEKPEPNGASFADLEGMIYDKGYIYDNPSFPNQTKEDYCWNETHVTEIYCCVPGASAFACGITYKCSGGCVDGACVDCVPEPEVCDGLDNDCDGSIEDDGVDETWYNQPTSCGVGECTATGQLICESGNKVDTCTPGTPSDEICDGVDNDCDGSIDEDLTQPTTCGVGACEGNTGYETCTGGSWGGYTCDPLAGASAETCDGLDNDCDGILDEDHVCFCIGGGICVDYPRTSTTLSSNHTESTKPGDVITLSGVVAPDRGVKYPLMVSVQHPDGTYAYNDVLWTDDHGNYQFQVTVIQRGYMRAEVRYPSDISSEMGFYRASGSEMIIPILPEIGMAIVVAGNGPSSDLFDTIEILADMAVSTFRRRNIPDDPSIPERNRIMYLHPDPSHDIYGQYGDGQPDADAEATVANLAWAIETWAAGLVQTKDSAGNWWPGGVYNTPLTIYLVGSINEDPDPQDSEFVFDVSDASNVISPLTLGTLLDNLENSIKQQFIDAGVELSPYWGLPINIIVEGPTSGDFIASLSKKPRVIITSTDSVDRITREGGRSYLSADGSVSFSTMFLGRIAAGQYIQPSFAHARYEILSNSAISDQKPQLEATGDGISNFADELATATMLLEYRQIGDARPRMQNAFGSITLQDTSTVNLWVYVNDPEDALAAVEVTIIPPEESFEETHVIQMNETIEWSWEGVYDGFYGEGIYTVVYTAIDEAGNVATPIVKSIIVEDTQPPLDVTDLSVMATFGDTVRLGWRASESWDTQGYKIYVTPPGAEEFLWADVGNVDFVNITGLDFNANPNIHEFRVTAYDRVPLESYGTPVKYPVDCVDPDNDGFGNPGTNLLECPSSTTQPDNCPNDYNPDQADSDGDGAGDVCDPCPQDPNDECNPSQSTGESIGNEGGTLILGTAVKADFPAGALDDHVSISVTGGNGTNVTDVPTFEDRTGATGTSLVYTFGPEGTTFNEPVTLTLEYNDTGIAEDTVDIYYYEPATQNFTPQGATVNTTTNEATLSVLHFSTFIVGAYTDADGDSYGVNVDCDDNDASTYPEAPELCDNKDNNCDGQIDETICREPTDADCDGVNDCTADKCPNTEPWVVEQELKPNHYDSSNWPASDINYGCSCKQVLDCKPGNNNGEFKFGCSQGTMDIWISQDPDSWAPDCQIDGVVAMEGVSKPLFENTDGTGLLDLLDGDNDGDGIPDSQDDMIEDQDEPGDPDYGIPDWHPKSKHKT